MLSQVPDLKFCFRSNWWLVDSLIAFSCELLGDHRHRPSTRFVRSKRDQLVYYLGSEFDVDMHKFVRMLRASALAASTTSALAHPPTKNIKIQLLRGLEANPTQLALTHFPSKLLSELGRLRASQFHILRRRSKTKVSFEGALQATSMFPARSGIHRTSKNAREVARPVLAQARASNVEDNFQFTDTQKEEQRGTLLMSAGKCTVPLTLTPSPPQCRELHQSFDCKPIERTTCDHVPGTSSRP